MKSSYKKIITLTLLGALAAPSAGAVAVASDNEHMIDVSSQCTRHFARLERQYGIPKHLMMAVGGTESGRWSNDLGMAVPWPWTINAEGKGQYFETMHDAVTAVRRLQAKGVKSIDVGCMQVNLKHHPDAFASLTQAFDPAYNTTYAAQFLHRNYVDTRSWSEAVAAYHSKGTQRGRDYFGRVKYNWRRVLAAVRGERLDDLPYVARGGDGVPRSSMEISVVEPGKTFRPLEGKKRLEDASIASYRSPSMKVITVSDRKTTSAGNGEVLVIRPTRQKQELSAVQVASNEVRQNNAGKEDLFVLGGDARKPVASRPAASGAEDRVSSRKHGPNFIFN